MQVDIEGNKKGLLHKRMRCSPFSEKFFYAILEMPLYGGVEVLSA